MALKVKAVEKKIKFSKEDPGVYRYVMQPDLYIALSQAKVIREAATKVFNKNGSNVGSGGFETGN